MDKETLALYDKLYKKLKEQSSVLRTSEKSQKVAEALRDLERSKLWYQEAHK